MTDINKDYRDSSHIQKEDSIYDVIAKGTIDEESQKLATWLRQKMYGLDVRESLALFVLLISTNYSDILTRQDKVENRQQDVEIDFADLLERFKDVLAGATDGMEVIDARNSPIYGIFQVLGDRITNIENIMSKIAPQGFDIILTHNLNDYPKTVRLTTYRNALDTELDGFESSGQVFGTTEKLITTSVDYIDSNSLKVSMPISYKPSTEVAAQATSVDGNFTISNVDKLVTSTNQIVEIVAVDSSYKELGRVQLKNGTEGILNDLITINKFSVGDSTITGTYTDKVAKVRLFISNDLTKSKTDENVWYLIQGADTLRFEITK